MSAPSVRVPDEVARQLDDAARVWLARTVASVYDRGIAEGGAREDRAWRAHIIKALADEASWLLGEDPDEWQRATRRRGMRAARAVLAQRRLVESLRSFVERRVLS